VTGKGKAPGKGVAAAAPKGKACPVCGKPAVEQYHPFCSKRCADVDLNRWLSGRYAIPGRAEEDEDGGPPESGPAS